MPPTGILLINLGTPDSPQKRDVKRYLNEFLTDGRVIDLPWLSRQLLVRGVIVPKRVRESSRSYQAIWTEEGSPLMCYGIALQNKLQAALGEKFHVALAMRYRNPSIDAVLKGMEGRFERLIILPLFPQYASATTGSVHQRVMENLSQWEIIPETTFINSYYNHPALIEAFCAIAQNYPLDTYDHILMSFHGLPERYLKKADRNSHCLAKKECCQKLCDLNKQCYSAQCHETARAIAEKLGIPKEHYSVCFQSRLGKEPWIQPYTSDQLKTMIAKGCKKILVMSPAFACDCLETIQEIGVEYNHEFKTLGGQKLDLMHGLNDHPLWIKALKTLVMEKLPINQSSIDS